MADNTIMSPSKILDYRLRGNDKDNITIVGSVRAYQKDDTCFIGKLVVLPEHQNKGIGKALMREIENQYKGIVKRYELFTGTRDPRNRYLYDQLGYKPFKTEKLSNEVSLSIWKRAHNTPEKVTPPLKLNGFQPLYPKGHKRE